MSLSYEKLQTVEVRDPRTILENKRSYAALRAGSQTTWKAYTTTSVSTSSIQFSAPPPSSKVIIDRKLYMVLPVRLTFVGTSTVGQTLINPNTDAPRAFPIASSIDTLQATINNQSASINIADIVQALMHFGTDTQLSQTDYSLTPSALDQSQAYSQLFGTVRNPLGSYGESTDQSIMGRGGFPFTIVSNPVFVSGTVTAVVDMVLCEPLFLSPMYFGKGNASGFYNVNTFDLNITFLGNAGNRMWSHDAVSGPASNISSISVAFTNFGSPAFSYPQTQPLLLFQYITPNETQILPYNVPITYPYFDVQRFPTDSQNAISAGVLTQLNSNNIQLNSIPRKMYIYVRERNQDLYNTSQNPDTYFSIENLSIQFQNKNGLLASASKQQLYEMSIKNHCDLSWTQWSGGPIYPTGTFSSTMGTIGSLVAIEFATDIGLDSIEAPGKLGQYMLQINVSCTNISNRSITPTLYIVVVSEGTFTVEGLGKASTNIGVINSQDILSAHQSPFISYTDVEEVRGSGNFFSDIKHFGNKLSMGLQQAAPYIQKALPYISQGVKFAKEISGMGCEECNGMGCQNCAMDMGSGVAVGGRRLKRSSLRDRMR